MGRLWPSGDDDLQVEGLARQLYPDLVGDAGLDSAKAFTVEYDADEEDKDKELSTHFDNAEVGVSFGQFPKTEDLSQVTVNVSLTNKHTEGELYFLDGGSGRAQGVEHR